ncbi:MAG: hypothetical protein U0M06_06540, partial [Clostridia bacterium]|nr:hypothetical protein [Clostridia bacterium]
VAEAVSGKMDKFGEVTLTPPPMPEFYPYEYIAEHLKLLAPYAYLQDISGDNLASVVRDKTDDPPSFEILVPTTFSKTTRMEDVIISGGTIYGTHISGLPTSTGLDPTQAANVEFVKKARDMQLLFDHTITESETSVWSYRVTLPFPIDKYYIYIEYPANLDTSHQFALNGTDANNTSTHVAYLATNTGTKVSVFRGEKLGTTITQWDTEFSYFHDFLYNCAWQPAYIALNLGNIVAFDVVDEQHFVEGTKIQIWGRDAI